MTDQIDAATDNNDRRNAQRISTGIVSSSARSIVGITWQSLYRFQR
jgi:hypothetical protein